MKIKVGEFKETAKATSIWSINTEMNKCHCHRRPMLLLKVIGHFVIYPENSLLWCGT